MKDNQRRGIKGFIFLSPLFIFFSFSFYHDVIQFFMEETNFTKGKLIETVMSPVSTNFYYNYSVNSITYRGNMDLVMKYNLRNEIFTVRYLINNPSKSVIDEYVFHKTIYYCIFISIAFFIQIYFVLLFIGIKSKWIY